MAERTYSETERETYVADGPSKAEAYPTEEETTDVEFVEAGSSLEALCAIGTVVLAILVLVGVLPFVLASIATIAAGAALLFKGGAIASRYSQVLANTEGGRWAASEIEGGASVEVLGGVAGVVLGILALLGLEPWILMACAVIAFGGTLLLGSGTTSRLNDLAMANAGISHQTRHVTRGAVQGAAGGQILVGLCAAALGILALVGLGDFDLTVLLTTIGLLAVGGIELISGAALGGRLAAMSR